MAQPLRLMAVLAHPDDESLGTGGALAKYAAEGGETYLVTATRGERGWQGVPADNPGLAGLGAIREVELRNAVRALGIRELHFLDYIDGDLDQADPGEAIAKIVGHLRRIKPQVVLTFGPAGAYGHPDHIAISQFTTAACVAAADPGYTSAGELAPHAVAKLYYMCISRALAEAYEAVFGDIVMNIDGVNRNVVIDDDWAITTWLDTSAYEETIWKAVFCHTSQLPAYSRLEQVPEQYRNVIWSQESYCRAFSLVNGGRAVERDLFEGLR
ncbi:MAG TPA: PIG-L family deacetylase [Roseiflexaceae bacterium]|nr:PIG-L family deacetylase [Roseiflexaceae bacterium]